MDTGKSIQSSITDAAVDKTSAIERETHSRVKIQGEWRIKQTDLDNQLKDLKLVPLCNINPNTDYGLNWATHGVIAHKGLPLTTKRGDKYSIWKVYDMGHTLVSLFVFGDAFNDLLRESIGTFIFIGAPKVQKDQPKEGAAKTRVPAGRTVAPFSLSVNHPEQIICIGRAASFTTCSGFSVDDSGTRRDCSEFVNKDISPLCLRHAKQSYGSYRANRMDLNRNINPLFDPLALGGAVALGVAQIQDLSGRKAGKLEQMTVKSNSFAPSTLPQGAPDDVKDMLARFNTPKSFLSSAKSKASDDIYEGTMGKRDEVLTYSEDAKTRDYSAEAGPKNARGLDASSVLQKLIEANDHAESGQKTVTSKVSTTNEQQRDVKLVPAGSMYSRRLLVAAGGKIPVQSTSEKKAIDPLIVAKVPSSTQHPGVHLSQKGMDSKSRPNTQPTQGPFIDTSIANNKIAASVSTVSLRKNTTADAVKFTGHEQNIKLSTSLQKLFKAEGVNTTALTNKMVKQPQGTFASAFGNHTSGTNSPADVVSKSSSLPSATVPATGQAVAAATAATKSIYGKPLSTKSFIGAASGILRSSPDPVDDALLRLSEGHMKQTPNGTHHLSAAKRGDSFSTTAPGHLTGVRDEVAEAVSSTYNSGDDLSYSEPSLYAPDFVKRARENAMKAEKVDKQRLAANSRDGFQNKSTGVQTEQEVLERNKAAELLANMRSNLDSEKSSQSTSSQGSSVKRVKPISAAGAKSSLLATLNNHVFRSLGDSDDEEEGKVAEVRAGQIRKQASGSLSKSSSVTSTSTATASSVLRKLQSYAPTMKSAEKERSDAAINGGLNIFLANTSEEDLKAAKEVGSRNEHILDADYEEKLHQRLDNAIRAEKLEEVLSQQVSREAKLWRCIESNCLNFGIERTSLSSACKANNHRHTVRDGEMRFFLCSKCGKRTQTLGSWHPTNPCICGAPLSEWRPASSTRLLGERMKQNEDKLLVRGVEHGFSLR